MPFLSQHLWSKACIAWWMIFFYLFFYFFSKRLDWMCNRHKLNWCLNAIFLSLALLYFPTPSLCALIPKLWIHQMAFLKKTHIKYIKNIVGIFLCTWTKSRMFLCVFLLLPWCLAESPGRRNERKIYIFFVLVWIKLSPFHCLTKWKKKIISMCVYIYNMYMVLVTHPKRV